MYNRFCRFFVRCFVSYLSVRTLHVVLRQKLYGSPSNRTTQYRRPVHR